MKKNLCRFQTNYFHQLIQAGDLEKMPEVLFKIYDDCNELRVAHPDDYRQFVYTITDDKTFTRSKLERNDDETKA